MQSKKKCLSNQELAIISGIRHEIKVLREAMQDEDLDRRVYFAHKNRLEHLLNIEASIRHGKEKTYADIEYIKSLFVGVTKKIDDYVGHKTKGVFVSDIFSSATQEHGKTVEWEEEVKNTQHPASMIEECLKHIVKEHPEIKKRMSKYKSWKKGAIKSRGSLKSQIGEWADLNYNVRVLEQHEERIKNLEKENKEQNQRLDFIESVVTQALEDDFEGFAKKLFLAGCSRRKAAEILGVQETSLRRRWLKWKRDHA